jgi:hypothetical protein
MVRFDHTVIHNVERVQERMEKFEFRRTEHMYYSLDLVLCDFFLFGAMKQASAGQHFNTIDDLFNGVKAFPGGLSSDLFQTVLQRLVQRFQLSREGGGEYVE